jgi:MFS superfamily sulfate permease-like transporter
MDTKFNKLANSMLASLRPDLLSGFVVFLVALPLCLGIAIASGAPVVAGIVSGVVAGIVVTWLSGSEMSISGPSASLTVTIATGALAMGSWQGFLAVGVIAGAIQVVLSIFRSGVIAAFFPNSVIKGMLAAIGLTIIFKQIPHALGWDSDYEGDESFFQVFDHSNTFLNILESLEHVAEGAILVSLAGFLVNWFWTTRAIKETAYLKYVPAPLMIVLTGVLVNLSFFRWLPQYALQTGSAHMVNVPSLLSPAAIRSALTFPDFSVLSHLDAWVLALVIALIGTMETLLSIEALDRMDPEHRVSDGNRELLAQGIGNVLSSFLGGLIMTSAIVRSSTNIYAGAKTRISCFAHGVFMLVFCILFATFLNQIPLAALAVVLITVGYKLVSPALVRSVWRLGLEQFIPFCVTLIAVVFSDLLTGVGIGLAVGFMMIMRMNHQSAITVVNDNDQYLIRFAKDVTFAHKLRFKRALTDLPEGCYVIIDGAGAQFIDFDILEAIKDFLEVAKGRNIKVEWKNLRSKRFKIGGAHGELQDPAFSK